MEPRAEPGRLVGRSEELQRLEAALAVARDGRGSTALISGEAGIGKTRLASELAERARSTGATVLAGRCIDLVGNGLPYLPLVEALRPLRGAAALADGLRELPPLVPELATRDRRPSGGSGGADSQLLLFEEVLVVLDRLGTAAPVVLVLEDLHWADASTLDLVAFLARAAADRRVLILATYRSEAARQDDPLRRLVAELLRARAAIAMELDPLDRDELGLLLAAVAPERPPAELVAAIHVRSEGNPFFAQELLAAANRGDERLPRVLREVLLQRTARLGADGRSVLRVVAAAGRDVAYRLLAAVASLPEAELLRALRQAVENDVLVPDQAAGTFRFRHALLAEAVYETLLPGEREELHGGIARALSENPGLGATRAVAGELAQHWAAADRPAEALAASLHAAGDAEAVSGLAEALRHLERALELWPRVPRAVELAGLDLGEVLARAAEHAHLTGSGQRAVELVRRALGRLDQDADAERAALLHERLGTYLLPLGDRDGGLAAYRRAVELVPGAPPSAERVWVLAALGHALSLSWRHAESRAACEAAIAVAGALGDDRPAFRAMDVLGVDLCYLGHPEEGLDLLGDARRRALQRGTAHDLMRNNVLRSDVLLTTGRLREAAKVALEELANAQRLGRGRSAGIVLAANAAEALIGMGDWARAEGVLAEALRAGGTFWTHHPHLQRAQLAIGRGELEVARAHLEAGSQGAREPSSAAVYRCILAELALWEGRPDSAAAAVEEGLRAAAATAADFLCTRLCALGLRAEAERAQLAAVRRDTGAVDEARQRAARLAAEARRSASVGAAVTRDAAGWKAVANAEHGRVEGLAQPERWQAAVAAWDELERPYLAAYCRWRQAEALLAAGRPAVEATGCARQAHRTAARLGARTLLRELELLAQRARLDLVGLLPGRRPDPGTALGLTAREGEVLQLLARGYTNREIAAELTISAKTASVHVTHILRKLGVSRRLEAAALAHRLAPLPKE